MTPMPLLRCRGLEAGYGVSQVLFGLDFDIRAGEVVAVLGRNGMGKSTTIRTLVGGLRARRGTLALPAPALHPRPADAADDQRRARDEQCQAAKRVEAHLAVHPRSPTGRRQPTLGRVSPSPSTRLTTAPRPPRLATCRECRVCNPDTGVSAAGAAAASEFPCGCRAFQAGAAFETPTPPARRRPV